MGELLYNGIGILVRERVRMREGIRDKYTGFSLKKDFVKAVKEKVESDPTYNTVTEFIRDAIREKLERSEVKQ